MKNKRPIDTTHQLEVNIVQPITQPSEDDHNKKQKEQMNLYSNDPILSSYLYIYF